MNLIDDEGARAGAHRALLQPVGGRDKKIVPRKQLQYSCTVISGQLEGSAMVLIAFDRNREV